MSKSYSSAKLTALVTAGAIALFAPQQANAVEEDEEQKTKLLGESILYFEKARAIDPEIKEI